MSRRCQSPFSPSRLLRVASRRQHDEELKHEHQLSGGRGDHGRCALSEIGRAECVMGREGGRGGGHRQPIGPMGIPRPKHKVRETLCGGVQGWCLLASLSFPFCSCESGLVGWGVRRSNGAETPCVYGFTDLRGKPARRGRGRHASVNQVTAGDPHCSYCPHSLWPPSGSRGIGWMGTWALGVRVR